MDRKQEEEKKENKFDVKEDGTYSLVFNKHDKNSRLDVFRPTTAMSKEFEENLPPKVESKHKKEVVIRPSPPP